MSNIISIIVLICLFAFFFLSMRRIMKRDNFIHVLILDFYDRATLSKEDLIKKIFIYCSQDWRLKTLVKKYNADENTFSQIFEKLIYWGNFKKGKRYVPISSFFFMGSLDYLLKHKEDDAKPLTMKMMNYFHI